MNQKIFETVIAYISEYMKNDHTDYEIPEGGIKPEHHLINDLSIDSLDQVEIIMELEREFNVGLPDDECGKLNTVEDLVNLIEKQLIERK